MFLVVQTSVSVGDFLGFSSDTWLVETPMTGLEDGRQGAL
jgi:hypothetical protein